MHDIRKENVHSIDALRNNNNNWFISNKKRLNLSQALYFTFF